MARITVDSDNRVANLRKKYKKVVESVPNKYEIREDEYENKVKITFIDDVEDGDGNVVVDIVFYK